MKNNFSLSVQTSPQHTHKESRAPVFNFYLKTVAIVLGLNYFCWNAGLNSGFWELIGSLIILWAAFLCQALSLAEMTGSLPFTGGSYALVRVTLGPWLGFLTGMLEISQSVISFALGLWFLSGIVNTYFNLGGNFQLEVCLPFLFALVGLNIWYSYFPQLWMAIFVSGLTVIIIWIIFLVGASQQVDFLEYENKSHKNHSIFAVNDSISVSVWFFICLTAIPSIAKKIHMPKQEFPKLFITASVITLVFALVTIFIASGQRPGPIALSSESLPLTAAYYNLFHSSLPSKRHAAWLSFPAIFYTSFLLFRVACQRLQSMCESGLIPHISKLLNRTQKIVHRNIKGKSMSLVFTSLLSSAVLNSPVQEPNSSLKAAMVDESDEQQSITKSSSHFTKESINKNTLSSTPSAPMLAAPLVASSPAHFHHHRKDDNDNNPHLKLSSSPSGISPIMINIFVGIVTFVVCILLRFQNPSEILKFAIYCTLCVSIAIMFAFMYFRKKFDCLETTFRSPIRIYGSMFGGSVFALTIVFMVIKQYHDLRIVISMIIYVILLTIYYFYAARRSQCFSEEEQRVMFVAYVINANIKSKLRRQSSKALLRRESSFGSMLQRTPSFFGENKSSSRSISISSPKHTLNSRNIRYKFSSAESTNRSVSVTSSTNRNSEMSNEDSNSNQRYIKFPHPRPVSSSAVGISTVGIAVSENEDSKCNGDATINGSSDSNTAAILLSPNKPHSRKTVGHDETSHHSSDKMSVKEFAVSDRITNTQGPPLTLRNSLSSPSQSDLLLTAPNSSKKEPSAQTAIEVSPVFPLIRQPTANQLSTSTMQLTLSPNALLSPEYSSPTAATDEEYPSSNNPSIVLSQNNMAKSSHVVHEVSPHNRSRKASFINWMISSISKTRIYTIPDDEEAENSVSIHSKRSNSNVNHSNSNINNSSNNSNRMNSNSNSSILNSFSSRKSNKSSPKNGESNKLTDSAVYAAVQDRLRELGQQSTSNEENQVSLVQSFTTGSFSVPAPTKLYRPSLGEVVTVMRRQSSNSEKLSNKVHVEAICGSNDISGDMCILDVEASLPVNRKNSAESDVPDVPDHENSNMNNCITSVDQNHSRPQSNNFHMGNYVNSRVSMKSSFIGSSKRMAKLSFFAGKTTELPQIHQDDNHYRENNDHYTTIDGIAIQNEVTEPARRGKRASLLAAKGMLRRSINQLSNMAQHVLPIADDQKEFDEYTKLFVQAILDDMEARPNSSNSQNEINNNNQIPNNERIGDGNSTRQEHLLDV